MENSFWFGYKLQDFLVPGFDIESPIGLIAVCLAVVMLVCIFESLKTSKIIKKLRSNTLDDRSFFRLAFSRSTEKSNLIERQENTREIWKVSDVFYHFIELVLGYLLMLLAMTYNGYVMISIAVGAALAYLTFGTVMMNITAQIVTQKMCSTCQMKPDGNSTPVTELVTDEDGPSTSANIQDVDEIIEETYTTVQVHS